MKRPKLLLAAAVSLVAAAIWVIGYFRSGTNLFWGLFVAWAYAASLVYEDHRERAKASAEKEVKKEGAPHLKLSQWLLIIVILVSGAIGGYHFLR